LISARRVGLYLLLAGLVPAVHGADAKSPASKAAPVPEADDELLDFLGSVDLDSADEDWLDYLAQTDIAKVAKAKKTVPAPTEVKNDE